MPSNELLTRLADYCLDLNYVYIGHGEETLSLGVIAAITGRLGSLTDVYITADKYIPDHTFVYRIITEQQNRLLAALWSSKITRLPPGRSLFLAMRLDADQTPAQLADMNKLEWSKRVVLGIL